MKRFLLPVTVAIALAVTSIAVPNPGYASASELAKVNKELQRVKKQIEQTQQLEKKAKVEIERVRNQKNVISEEVARLEQEITVTSEKIKKVDRQLKDVATNLEHTTLELVEAEERVETRDGLLKSRLQLLYMNGFVSYMDVLLSSTSFTDFLDRIDAIKSIVTQDKEILALNVLDKQTVERKKQDVEAQLKYVEQLFAETTKLKNELTAKRENREVAIASLDNKEHALEEITEEQEQDLLKLADEQAKLIKKQKELQNKNKKNTKKVVKYTGGQLKWPVPSSDRITSMFGTRVHPITKKKHTHSGLDIGAPSGTTIAAAASGEVILAQWYGGYGNCIIIEHKDGFRTLYAHIRTGGIKVKVGDTVEAGEKIAEVGSTGNSTGNHLHFGVYVNNTAVDPLPYLQ